MSEEARTRYRAFKGIEALFEEDAERNVRRMMAGEVTDGVRWNVHTYDQAVAGYEDWVVARVRHAVRRGLDRAGDLNGATANCVTADPVRLQQVTTPVAERQGMTIDDDAMENQAGGVEAEAESSHGCRAREGGGTGSDV